MFVMTSCCFDGLLVCVWAQLCPFPNQTHSEPGFRSLKRRQSSLSHGSREPPFKLPLTSSCGDCLYEPHVSILSFPLEERKRRWTHTEQLCGVAVAELERLQGGLQARPLAEAGFAGFL